MQTIYMQKNLYNKKHNRAPLRHSLAVFHLAPPTEDRAELVRWALPSHSVSSRSYSTLLATAAKHAGSHFSMFLENKPKGLSYVAPPRLLHFSYYFRPGSNGVGGGYPESGGGQKSILGYQVLADLAPRSVWARFILLFSPIFSSFFLLQHIWCNRVMFDWCQSFLLICAHNSHYSWIVLYH